jgi:hypothetical protein
MKVRRVVDVADIIGQAFHEIRPRCRVTTVNGPLSFQLSSLLLDGVTTSVMLAVQSSAHVQQNGSQMAYRRYIDSSAQPDGWMAMAFLFLSILALTFFGVPETSP